VTIKKGQPWGEAATPPADAIRTSTDREISRALDDARVRNEPFPSFVVGGGDLGRTLAASVTPATAFPIDVGEVLLDGKHHYFVAHVVARTPNWRRFAVAMNAQWVGEWNLGPKAHPNDGILDGYEAELGYFDWRKVRSRLPTGAHLPHPRITVTRAKAVTFEFAQPRPVYVDGDLVGSARHVAARLIPDALTVYA
jgi:hypothetical protein